MFRLLREQERQPLDGRSLLTRVSAQHGMVHRLSLQRKLEGHRGCVNTVCFSPSGELLASGSDDQSVMIWDWNTGAERTRVAGSSSVPGRLAPCPAPAPWPEDGPYASRAPHT